MGCARGPLVKRVLRLATKTRSIFTKLSWLYPIPKRVLENLHGGPKMRISKLPKSGFRSGTPHMQDPMVGMVWGVGNAAEKLAPSVGLTNSKEASKNIKNKPSYEFLKN